MNKYSIVVTITNENILIKIRKKNAGSDIDFIKHNLAEKLEILAKGGKYVKISDIPSII